jgi:threonine/homoserine/homoserine lactone efflux protein
MLAPPSRAPTGEELAAFDPWRTPSAMAISSLPATMLSAFLVTLATVVVPNPSTIVAGRFALTRGWRAAATFLAAVVLVDLAVFCALVFGFQPLLHSVGGTAYLVPVAASGMVLAGAVMMVRPPRFDPAAPGGAVAGGPPPPNGLHGPFLAGLVVPSTNPGFWVWWMTVGTAFIHAARHWGDLGLASLLGAMVAGVLAWYLPLVLALRRGATLVPPRALGRVLRLFGAALVVFGAHLLLHLFGLMP